jgi:ribA/ribD-fused uncharacterized protein
MKNSFIISAVMAFVGLGPLTLSGYAMEHDEKDGLSEVRASDVIKFYERGEAFYELTNFYGAPFQQGTRIWNTSEHGFQGNKFILSDREDIADAIEAIAVGNPKGVFNIAKTNNGLVININWHGKVGTAPGAAPKDRVMAEALRLKFSTHSELTALLLATAGFHLVEDAGPNDAYWGNGKKGTTRKPDMPGNNRLGEELVNLREKLLAGPFQTFMVPPGHADAQITAVTRRELTRLGILDRFTNYLAIFRKQGWGGVVTLQLDSPAVPLLAPGVGEARALPVSGPLHAADHDMRGGGTLSVDEVRTLLSKSGSIQTSYGPVDVSGVVPQEAMNLSDSMFQYGLPHALETLLEERKYVVNVGFVKTLHAMQSVFKSGGMHSPKPGDLMDALLKRDVQEIYTIILGSQFLEPESFAVGAAACVITKERLKQLKSLWD